MSMSRSSAGWRLVAAGGAAVTAAGAARLAYYALNRHPPGGPKMWSRINHRSERVTLLEGPAVALGAIAGTLVQAALAQEGALAQDGARARSGTPGWRAGSAIAVAGAGAAAFGAYDDLAGTADRRGFRGHLGALRHGEVTTGAAKLGGIGATGIASAVLAGGSPADLVINAGLVAGGANLLNLFDLRPGRAIKVATASAALICAAGSAATARPRTAASRPAPGRAARSSADATLAALPPLAAALALLPEDLGERAMLGDAGANALGAMLGAAAARLPRLTRVVMLAGIAGLTAASEKVSFTKVIEQTPALHRLDMLGRRPAGPAPTVRIPVQRHHLHSAMTFNGTGTSARSAEKNNDIAPTEE
jgi:UDP-GlcNAc:undecaprenyl-phosphate/decaprenyl-phosphate GlcNAc-1-phosphate transferase